MITGTPAARPPLAQRPWVLPVCAAILIHLPSLRCPLLYDDVPLIETHPLLGSPGFLVQIWQRDCGLEFARAELGDYRPLFTLLVHLAHAAWGSAAFCYHLVSLILFALTTTLVTSVASLASNRSRAVALAAEFLLQPGRAEYLQLRRDFSASSPARAP